MITCEKKFLERRCEERGYTLEEVMPCVVSQNGDLWTIDETHWSYPKVKRPGPTGGPGTELKALLKYIGITSTPNCSCNARAKQMDEKGADWCEENIDTILEWLKEQAKTRGLPFVSAGAKVLVKRAISNARRKAALQGNNR